MRKKIKITNWQETILSIAVVSITVEILHFFLLQSSSTVIINKAIFFGSFGNNLIAILCSIVLLSIIGVSYFYHKIDSISFTCLASGGLINLSDRLVHDGTIDYIHFMNIPTFNIPDILIVLSICLLLGNHIFDKKVS